MIIIKKALEDGMSKAAVRRTFSVKRSAWIEVNKVLFLVHYKVQLIIYKWIRMLIL